MKNYYLITLLSFAFASFCNAGIELKIDQVEAYEDGGYFYIIATPTAGESVEFYDIQLKSNSTTSFTVGPMGPGVSVDYSYGAGADGALGTADDNIPAGFADQTALWGDPSTLLAPSVITPNPFPAPPAAAQPTTPGLPFIVGQVVYQTTDPSSVEFSFQGVAPPNEGTKFGIVDALDITFPDPINTFPGNNAAQGALIPIIPDFIQNRTGMFSLSLVQPYNPVAVPEPSSFAFLGLLGIAGFVWNKRYNSTTSSVATCCSTEEI